MGLNHGFPTHHQHLELMGFDGAGQPPALHTMECSTASTASSIWGQKHSSPRISLKNPNSWTKEKPGVFLEEESQHQIKIYTKDRDLSDRYMIALSSGHRSYAPEHGDRRQRREKTIQAWFETRNEMAKSDSPFLHVLRLKQSLAHRKYPKSVCLINS